MNEEPLDALIEAEKLLLSVDLIGENEATRDAINSALDAIRYGIRQINEYDSR